MEGVVLRLRLYVAGECRKARSFQLDRFLRGSVSIRDLICTPTPGTQRLALIVRIGIALSWEHGETNEKIEVNEKIAAAISVLTQRYMT